MPITKEPPEKGLAGAQKKKTGFTKDPPAPGLEGAVPKPKVPLVAQGEIEGFGRWTLDNTGRLMIHGTGILTEEIKRKLPYNSCTIIQIDDGVTAIGHDALRLTSAKKIVLPSSLTSIGHAAFYMSDLEEITIPCSVTRIEPNIFWHCENIRKVIMPTRFNRSIFFHGFNIANPLGSLYDFRNYFGIPKRLVKFQDC